MNIITSLRFSKIMLAITLLVLIFLSYFSFIRLQDLIAYGKLVDETNRLKFKASECMSLLKDAETGQRGFLLSRDSSFLVPLHTAQEKIDGCFDELMKMAIKDREFTRLVVQFRIKAKTCMSFIDRVLNENHDHIAISYSGPYKHILLQGKELMNEVRVLGDSIMVTSEQKLGQREATKDRYELITPVIMIVLAIVSVILIIIAYMIIDRELRKRITLTTELEYNLSALKRSNSDLEQFAYVASHDLQEPLRKIQTFGNRLAIKHKDNLNDDGQFIIDRMQNAAARMQILINDLLIYSRISNIPEKKFDRTDLNISIENAIDVLNDAIILKKANITFGKLPVIEANSSQMEQLFQNLLSNALKFTRENSVPDIRITCSLVDGSEIREVKFNDRMKKFHKITVSDNGIGFEDQYAEKIFVIFQRLQGKSEYSGTGIGLAICKKIITNHEGYIAASSKPGKGTSFMIYLPKI